MLSEQLEESLRREIEGYVERRLSGLRQEITQLQNQLNETLSRLLEDKGESQWDGSLAASITEHLHAAHERGVELAASESSRAQASSDMAIVKASIEEIEGQRSQTEVLKALVNRSSSFAPRVAFFIVKGEEARGWRARGFQGTVGDEAVQQITFPLPADTVIGEAFRTCETWSGTPNSHSEDYLLMDRFGEQAPQRLVAVPLVVRDRTVAVLYADSAELDSDAIKLEALETLARVAGMAVELLSVRQAAAKREVGAARLPAQAAETIEGEPAYKPEREYEEGAPVEAAAEREQETATIEADPDTVAEAYVAPVEPAPPPVGFAETISGAEPVAVAEVEPAAETIESAPVVAPSETTPAASATRRRYGSYETALPVEVSDEEEKRQHNDARRFARLLVSEIKLYNENKVIEGRSRGDLYERLREYIDRSREMYDKRVKPVVSEKYDYFHHELVNTLAEGDVTKLGHAYPGTTVSA